MTLSDFAQVITMSGVIITGMLGILSYRRAGHAVEKVAAVDDRVKDISVKVDGQLTRLFDVLAEAENAKGEKVGLAIGIAQGKAQAEEVAAARMEDPHEVARVPDPPIETHTQFMLRIPHIADSIIGTFIRRNKP